MYVAFICQQSIEKLAKALHVLYKETEAPKTHNIVTVMNLVFETVGMISIFAARQCGVSNIVLTGNLTRLAYSREKFEEFNNLGYGVRFLIPKHSEYSTVIGATLLGLK